MMIHSKPAPDLANWIEGERAGDPKSSFLFAYSGRSMYPTLREPDFLVAEWVDFQQIKLGDVIIFKIPDNATIVVHRVFRKSQDCLSTRGDNLDSIDPWLILDDNYIGRVFQKKTGAKTRPVYGGVTGMAIHTFLQAARKARSQLGPLAIGLRAIVRFLRIDHLAEKILRPVPISYQTSSGRVVRLVSRGKVIGEYSDKKGRWSIRFPYRYVIRRDQPPA